MKSMKPAFYVLIAVIFAALLYVVNLYKNTIDPFENKEIMSHFQNMSTDQKGLVCSTLNEQLASYTDQLKNATSEQQVIMQKELAELRQTASEYGC
jgi:hypothetical protein